MNKLDQTVADYLKIIGAGCPRLLNALNQSPEAVWGEIEAMEAACRAFNKTCGSAPAKPAVATKITTLVAKLRGQMLKQGLMDHEEFAVFRKNVRAIQSCAASWRTA